MNPEDLYKYCPRCKNEFIKHDGFLKCENCGLTFYINPSPCTGIIFYSSKDPNKIMLVRRAVDPSKGKLDVAGGFMATNETFEDGASRESMEELGIQIKKNELVYLDSFYTRYLYQDTKQYIACVVFTYELDESTELKSQDDIDEVIWMNVNDIKPDDLSFETLGQVLDNYKLKFLKSR